MPPFLYPTPDPTDSPSSRDESQKRKLEDDFETAAPQCSEVKRQRVSVDSGNLCYPASYYAGYRPPLPVTTELDALNALAAIWNSEDRSSHEYNIWQLDGFSIYRKGTDYRHAYELCPLQNLKTEDGVNGLLFDGILSIDGEGRFVQGVSFECLAIEGYGDESDTVSACIQTALAHRANVWFQLGTPANQYRRYHDTFLWVSRFTKYVVDFLGDSEQPVTLSRFRRSFYPYVVQKHGSSSVTHSWLEQHSSHDFGQAFCANLGFIIKECYSLNQGLLKEPIFGETDTKQLKAIPMEKTAYQSTVVTPFVFELFRKMPFHDQMQVLSEVSIVALQKQERRRIQLGLTPLKCRSTPVPKLQPCRRAVRKGDVVSVAADNSTQWRASTGNSWFAYVQEVRSLKSGAQKVDVLWLYEPSDTTLGHGHYPYKNELFMSDNCSCGKDSIDAELVQSIITINWYATNPSDSKGCFFVRQKFRTEPQLGAYDFVQLQESDFRCGCNDSKTEMDKVKQDFTFGDTVLVHQVIAGKESLEPAVIRGFNSNTVTLQTFLRCHRDLGDKDAAPNQLTLIDATIDLEPDCITRHCRVITFANAADIRTPYNRNGAGDLWFVISSLPPTWTFVEHELAADSKIKGMGIFCGSGSFDRGLEEGGGLEFKWGIDWAERALHSYRANVEEPQKLNLFLGSVNDYLGKAIQGTKDSRVATIGDVDLLAAGSPCPGFSILQRDRNSVQSLRNCSLVASVCSYVDFYMPTYLVLENVIGMARNPSNAKDLNVFSQVLCCLVSMGYQVQQLLMDPGHYGSCQSRQRIFVIATAPGHKAPAPPPQTHTCSELETHARAIGYASNGLPFGKRKHDVCPFVSLTAKEAFQDLPDIGDSHVQTCIAAPDHRTCRHESSKKRALIQMIPRWPYGQGFVQAVARGKMSKNAIASYAWQNKNRASANSKSWARIYPDRLVGCLTTDIKPHDSFLGRTLHYDQHRTMSVIEARRVQGLPDHEVILGTPSQQWNQIGNGVDRKVALAIGMRIADACRETLATERDATASSSLPFVTDASTLQIASLVQHETVVRGPIQSSVADLPTTVAVTDKNIAAGSIGHQRCSGRASTAHSVELATKSTLVCRSIVQGVSEVPHQQATWKDDIEYIIID